MTTALERGEGSASRPGRSLPPGKTRYPLNRRLGRPQGRSGKVRKISPPPGFDPRTVQPVASRSTDYATRPIAFSVILFHSAPSIHCFLHPLIPTICISYSVSTIHLFLGLPLTLVPIGFHSNNLLRVLLSSIRIT